MERIEEIVPNARQQPSNTHLELDLVQTGEVDNCQVGVYASLVRGDKATLIDMAMVLVASSSCSRNESKSGYDLPVRRSEIEWVLKQMLPSRGLQRTRSSHFEKRLRWEVSPFRLVHLGLNLTK